MFVIDNFLGFVFRTIATAVDREMNDDTQLKRRLVEAQLAVEEGRIDEHEFAEIERDVFDRLRALRGGDEGPQVIGGDARVVSANIDADLGDDD
jgi:hypothetical protein